MIAMKLPFHFPFFKKPREFLIAELNPDDPFLSAKLCEFLNARPYLCIRLCNNKVKVYAPRKSRLVKIARRLNI